MAAGAGAGAGRSKALASLLQNQRLSSSSSDAFFLYGSSFSLGSRSMVSFEDVNCLNGSKNTFLRPFDRGCGSDDVREEDLDEYFHQPEKKRRLTTEQVRFLEKNFELENKLEPERKVQLAKDLGLQPRQVAIWFQNRRARWKTKQLEKEYEDLQASYNGLKADYDGLLEENDKLKAEVHVLKDKLLVKANGAENPELSTKESQGPALENTPPHAVASDEEKKGPVMMLLKQDDFCSAKSEILDTDSPNGGHSSFMEHGDSSYAFEPDVSESSQDDEDVRNRPLAVPQYLFPKLEEDQDGEDYRMLPPQPGAGNLGFTSPEDQAFWSSWTY